MGVTGLSVILAIMGDLALADLATVPQQRVGGVIGGRLISIILG